MAFSLAIRHSAPLLPSLPLASPFIDAFDFSFLLIGGVHAAFEVECAGFRRCCSSWAAGDERWRPMTVGTAAASVGHVAVCQRACDGAGWMGADGADEGKSIVVDLSWKTMAERCWQGSVKSKEACCRSGIRRCRRLGSVEVSSLLPASSCLLLGLWMGVLRIEGQRRQIVDGGGAEAEDAAAMVRFGRRIWCSGVAGGGVVGRRLGVVGRMSSPMLEVTSTTTAWMEEMGLAGDGYGCRTKMGKMKLLVAPPSPDLEGRRTVMLDLSWRWRSSAVELGEDDDGVPSWCSVLRQGTVNGVPADVNFVF
ncbi:hypothetical protein ACLOJK_030782 [Asimina triloba]